jgi:peptide/nickel transport system permease protein
MNPVVSLLLQRVGIGFLLILAISALLFIGVELLPGDFARNFLGQSATPEAVANIRKELGLDEPLLSRYLDWLGGVLTGDFGNSWANKASVNEQLFKRLSNTLFLATVAAIFAVPISIGLGMVAVFFRNRLPDHVINILSLAAISMPEFFIGYLIIFFFALLLGIGDGPPIIPSAPTWPISFATWGSLLAVIAAAGVGIFAATLFGRWTIRNIQTTGKMWLALLIFLGKIGLIVLPAVLVFRAMEAAVYSSFENVQLIALPVLTLVVVVLAAMMRMTRAAILNIMESAYIETAELKGVNMMTVIRKHAAPNAISPIINVVALNLAYLVVGVIVVEVIFAYPGMGQYFVDAVTVRDMPVVQACGVVFAGVYIILNMFADVGSILANPRLMHPK